MRFDFLPCVDHMQKRETTLTHSSSNPFGSKCRSYRSYLLTGLWLPIRYLSLYWARNRCGSLNITATLQNKHKPRTKCVFLISEVGLRRCFSAEANLIKTNKQSREQRRPLFMFYCKQ